jgi:hypothetical protein
MGNAFNATLAYKDLEKKLFALTTPKRVVHVWPWRFQAFWTSIIPVNT